MEKTRMMSRQPNKKNNPLPSFLSNIRNAVQTTTTSRAGAAFHEDRAQRQQEFRPLIASSAPPTTTADGSEEQEARYQKFLQRFEIIGRKSYIRGRDRKDASAKRGFRVQLPTSILVYVTVIFFIVPLLVSLLLLVRELVKYHSKSNVSTITHDLTHTPSKDITAQHHSKDEQASNILDTLKNEPLGIEEIDKLPPFNLQTKNESISTSTNTTYLRSPDTTREYDTTNTEVPTEQQESDGDEVR